MRYVLLGFLFAILACSINAPEVAADGKVRAGLSAGAGIAISFDAPSYAYTGSPRTVEATVTVSEPNGRTGNVSVTGPGTITPNVFPVPPYSNTISVTLPAEVGEYTYTATAERENAPPAEATTTVYVVSVASLTASGATEFDDGDGNENTKAYAVGIGTGDVTVIATPSPAIDESLLPYDWSLSGGTGSGKTTRTVSKSTAGVTTVTCTCGSFTKSVTIYVVEVASLTTTDATEYDDGDEDANTKGYATGVATEGDVTITAACNPSTTPTAALTAAGWELTGGTGTDSLTRTVTKTTAAETIFTCTCGTSSKSTSVYVVEVDSLTSDANEFDDDDADSDTKAYAIGIDTAGEITVTATYTPSDAPVAALAAAGWSLTGGIGTDPLSRTVTKTIAAKTDLACSCGSSSKAVSVYVVAVESLTASDATEFDDGDEDIDTKSYATGIAITGNVTVTATCTPSTTPIAGLRAAGWSLVGGKGIDLLTRTVTMTKAAITEVTCTCGSSSKAVKVYVIQVDLGISGVADQDEDTVPGVVVCNTDDDNRNSVQDKYDNDSVSGENDLIPLTMEIQPSGLSGQVTLSHNTSNVAIWQSATRGSTTSPLSWDLSAGTLPKSQYLEGKVVSTDPGDQIITLTYTVGSLTLTDTVKATVIARTGSSEARLGLYRKEGDEYLPISGNIGGKVYIGLEIKLGESSKLDGPSSSNLKILVQEDDTSVHALKTIQLPSDMPTDWRNKTPSGSWTSSSSPFSIARAAGDPEELYRGFIEWDTTAKDASGYDGTHNGAHTIKLIDSTTSEETELRFNDWDNDILDWKTPAYNSGPTSTTAKVKNLVITDVTTSSGNVDYIKYDPDPDSPFHRPTIKFTIEDDGDPHEYEWVIYITSTARPGLGTFGTVDSVMAGNRSSTGVVNTTWEGISAVSGIPDTCERGIYTFDIYIWEYDDVDSSTREQLDANQMKTPYCLWGTNDESWWDVPEDGGATTLRFAYSINNQCGENADDFSAIVIDSEINERCCESTVSGAVDVVHGEDGGLIAYTSPEGIIEPWRIVFTAEDTHRADVRRDHNPPRMLAFNCFATTTNGHFYLIHSIYSNTPNGAEIGLYERGMDINYLYSNIHRMLAPDMSFFIWTTTYNKLVVGNNPVSGAWLSPELKNSFKPTEYSGFCGITIKRYPHLATMITVPINSIGGALSTYGARGGVNTNSAGTRDNPDRCIIKAEGAELVGVEYIYTNTILHELGHCIGLEWKQHRSRDCPANNCVMTPVAEDYVRYGLGTETAFGTNFEHRNIHINQRKKHIKGP